MRTINSGTVYYNPEPMTAGVELNRYVETELFKIRTAITLLAAGHVEKTHVAPVKPKEGDIRLADGTNWNPGAGAGFYGYYNNAWFKLG